MGHGVSVIFWGGAKTYWDLHCFFNKWICMDIRWTVLFALGIQSIGNFWMGNLSENQVEGKRLRFKSKDSPSKKKGITCTHSPTKINANWGWNKFNLRFGYINITYFWRAEPLERNSFQGRFRGDAWWRFVQGCGDLRNESCSKQAEGS